MQLIPEPAKSHPMSAPAELKHPELKHPELKPLDLKQPLRPLPLPVVSDRLSLTASSLTKTRSSEHATVHSRANLTANSVTSSQSHADRVALFIDGSNLFYAAMQLGVEVDYTKLLRCLTGNRRLLRAYFYTGVDSTNEKQQGFLLWMRRNGYRVVAKELIQFADGSRKVNLDVEMAIDMINLANYCNTLVLLSGDGDLSYAVDAVSYRGVQVEIVGLRSMTSDSLINVADQYIDLETIATEIQR